RGDRGAQGRVHARADRRSAGRRRVRPRRHAIRHFRAGDEPVGDGEEIGVMDRRARPLSELWPRALRFFAIALLIGWCVATAWEFGLGMRGPAGLFVFRTPGTE